MLDDILYHKTTPIINGARDSTIEGSGFYYWADDGKLFCITNKHVVDNIFTDDDGAFIDGAKVTLLMRFKYREPITLELPCNSIIMHPDLDLVGIKVTVDVLMLAEASGMCIIEDATSTTRLLDLMFFKYDDIPTDDQLKRYSSLTDVAMFSYPNPRRGCRHDDVPLARTGCLAFPADKDYNDMPIGYINLQSRPGESGAPVIVPNCITSLVGSISGGAPQLLGIHYGMPTTDTFTDDQEVSYGISGYLKAHLLKDISTWMQYA